MSAITRSTDHRYTYAGTTYPGVTDVLKVIDKSGPLMAWAARQTAEAAIDLQMVTGDNGISSLNHLLLSTGREGAVKALTSRSGWKRDEAAHLGTQVHALAEYVGRGEPIPFDGGSDIAIKYATRYHEWWAVAGWTIRLQEAMVVNPDVGYGGTFDILARDADGRTVLADIKTGKGVYKETILQLTAYGMAPWVQPQGGSTVYPMPVPERYVVLHVTGDNPVREVEISVGEKEKHAFLDCVDLHSWLQSVKGKDL